jgi:hypothetical protein
MVVVVVVEKAFARRLSWCGWSYSFAKKRKVYGLHIVVLIWCSVRWTLAGAGSLSPVASEALVCDGRLQNQGATGRSDAQRGPRAGFAVALDRRL